MDYMDSLSKCDGSSITRNKETKIYQYHLLYHSQLKNKSHWYDTCIVTPVLINITSSKPTSSSMAATSWGSGIAPGGAHSSRKENLSMPDLIRNLSTNFFSFTIMASFSASSTWVVSFCFHSSKAQANCKSTFYIIKWQSMTCKIASNLTDKCVPDFIQTVSTIIITSLVIPKKNLFWKVRTNPIRLFTHHLHFLAYSSSSPDFWDPPQSSSWH